MHPSELTDLLHRQPFVPFRIHMSDGTVYLIPHRDFLMVGVASAVVGFPDPASSQLYIRTEIIALSHIVRVEPLEKAPQAAQSA